MVGTLQWGERGPGPGPRAGDPEPRAKGWGLSPVADTSPDVWGTCWDRQIFDFTVSGAPGSTKQGRRHAAKRVNGEAAKRPSKGADDTLAVSPLKEGLRRHPDRFTP